MFQVQLKMPLFQALEAKKKLGESAKSLSSAQRKSKWDIQGVSNHLHQPNQIIYISSDVACWQWDGLGRNCDISFWKFEQEEVAKQLICPQDFSDANQLKTRMTTEMQNAWRQKRNGKKRKKKMSNNIYCM